MAVTAPSQNTRPTTAASWSNDLSSGRSVSSLAATSACTVSGTATCLDVVPLGEHARKLLGVQWVPARPFE